MIIINIEPEKSLKKANSFKDILSNFIGHLTTITAHKMLVLKYCFKVGLYKQGLLHDISKYSPTEFFIGIKYYQGIISPNSAEREDKGYSEAWLHHKGRNRHHFEYWIDYSAKNSSLMTFAPMPVKYIIEMFCDRVAASKIYKKGQYTNKDPYNYFINSSDHLLMCEDTKNQLLNLLTMLKDQGEDYTFAYIKNMICKKQKHI